MPDFTALGIVPRCRQWGFPLTAGREGGRRVEGCDVTSISRSIRRDAVSGASAHGGDRGKFYMGKIIDSGDRYVCITCTYARARTRAHTCSRWQPPARLGMLRPRSDVAYVADTYMRARARVEVRGCAPRACTNSRSRNR